MNTLPFVTRLFSRAEERQRLIPREGPSALQQFYRTLGRFMAKLNEWRNLPAWVMSKWYRYERLADEVTEARYEADGRALFRSALVAPLKAIPIAGPLVNAAHTETQSVLLWRTAQAMQDSDALKDVIETIALLKEAKATGQALATPISLGEVLGGPIAGIVGNAVAKKAVKWIVPRLMRAIMSADRDELAHALHARAVDELKGGGDPPGIQDIGDRRRALYVLAVLQVSPAVLNEDGEDTGVRDVRAALD